MGEVGEAEATTRRILIAAISLSGMQENRSKVTPQEVLEAAFFDMYGIPLSWAKWLSEQEGETGEYARGILGYFGKIFNGKRGTAGAGTDERLVDGV